MKRYIKFVAAAMLAILCSCTEKDDPTKKDDNNPVDYSKVDIQSYDFSILASKKHPRLYFDDKDFADLKEEINNGSNPYVSGMHRQIMEYLDNEMKTVKHAYYTITSNGLYLDTSAHRLIHLAYGYRLTGEQKYLDYAKMLIADFCGFPDWNAIDSFLNTSDLCMALGFAYDWLYDSLTQDEKSLIISKVKEYAFAFRNDQDNHWWRNTTSNWNQVCNGALVLVSLAICEEGDKDCPEVIKEAVASNYKCINKIYEDGIYAEGPNYWAYGTSFQAMMNLGLEYVLGTDFGLSNFDCIKKTIWYKIFSKGNTGAEFNYADCDETSRGQQDLWYFAYRFKDTSILFNEAYNATSTSLYTNARMPLVHLYAAHKLGNFSADKKPSQRLFSGRNSSTSIILARSGWEKDDLYLGFKGGRADKTHAHMDGGEFVCECDGIRWSIDYDHPEYGPAKDLLHSLGEDLFATTQDALRFQFITINNRFHSTLTVNDKDHCVSGDAILKETFDEPGKIGGTLDLGYLFYEDLLSAKRTAVIKDNSYFEITDAISTKSTAPAHIRWSMLTRADVTMTSDGFELAQDGKKMVVRVTGCTPELKTWSTNPKDYPGLPIRAVEEPLDANLIGYEYDIPAGTSVKVVTTISRK